MVVKQHLPLVLEQVLPLQHNSPLHAAPWARQHWPLTQLDPAQQVWPVVPQVLLGLIVGWIQPVPV